MAQLKVNVKVHWVDEKQGGKVRLPLNQRYYVTTESMKGKGGKACPWSLALDITSNNNEGGSRVGFGTAYFLFDEAPDFLLIQGAVLNVYEGPKRVAMIEVF
ncbi:hypothetical protein ID854_06830 [Xenorhabdus sp. M]|uniref:Uncharacterized protein n=1 Tax=Xenorhabdus szentirmaii TaxID=290112 RepID=A0AAW3YQ62_9GAMM|nr:MULTISPECIES: hypothetical protein [unclassified Xenorhabdus]MBD2800183.1 hypothetical protein [Xenorhabdus sp. M]MBD2804836.1 hypothetical protein [Xenorhabdus sp. ZM]